MNISHSDALKILGLSSGASFEDIKKAYRVSCSKYHPDKNPAGLEMMKMVNLAWASLQDFIEGSIRSEDGFDASEYGDELNAALNAIIDLGLDIEICGSWIWVSGDTRPHREALKGAGFKWASKKLMWNFRPAGWKSRSKGSYSMDDIREKHGSVSVKLKPKHRISA